MKKITFTTALLASACAFAGFEGHVSADGYVPGLQQGIFRNGGRANVNFSATCAESDRFSHTLGTILADANAGGICQTRNELTGAIEKWEENAAILYEGEMYFEGGQEYNFFGCIDDFVACQLDGVHFWCEGLPQSERQGVSVFSKTFKESGWHPIRVWLVDALFGHGALSGRVGFQGVGIGWNTNGCKVVNGTTQLQWNRLLDDGSGRFLRSKVLPQKSLLQDKCGPVGRKNGEVRVFGAQDGLPIEIEMTWVAGRGEVEGFWVSKNRITQRQWKDIMGYNPVDKDKQDDAAPIEQLSGWGDDIVDFLWGLNARYTGAGRFARVSDAQWQLAAKYCTVGIPLEFSSLRIAFRPMDKRNSEREVQKLVKRGSDVAFEAMLAKGEAKRYSLADSLDLDVIKVEGCGDAFYLGRYEVTQEQYEKVMASNPSIYSGVDNLPVSSVNWTNAMTFCEKLNALVPVEGMTWTLPSSKQWAFAANGGLKKKTASFFGGDKWQEVGWWGGDEYGHWYTRPVGLKKPNELGFHDLFGNCWEWCCDGDGRADFKYVGGPGLGLWGVKDLIRSFETGNVNQSNADFGFRVALVPNAQLVHRWSFTKDFVDSIGKVEAKRTAKIVKLEDGKCVCEKGGLDLGDALQGAGTPFTVELWYMETKHEYGGRVFTASAPNSEVGWATGDGNEGFFYVVRQKSEEDQARGTPEMQFGLNRWYYLAITYDGVNVTGYKCDLEGDRQVRSYPVPLNLIDRERILKLGTTCWGDLGVFAKYDEVRVWKGCRSKEDIEYSVKAGPDRIVMPKTLTSHVRSRMAAVGSKDTEGRETVDGYTWSYRVKNGEAEIVVEKDGKFSCAVSPNLTGEVKIPETLGGAKVTSIGERAFLACKAMTSVKIPEGITRIGGWAFEGCSGLTSVVIPNGVTTVEGCTFWGCGGLKSVTIPPSVTTIADAAFGYCGGLESMTIPPTVKELRTQVFFGCGALKSVTIPASVEKIGWASFVYSGELKEINVDPKNKWFTSVGGAVYTKDLTEMVACPNALTSLTIPSSVKKLRDAAIISCGKLESLIIPEGVTDIGWQAVKDCCSLKSVSIPSTVRSIAEIAFWNCGSLTAVTIPANVSNIGARAFGNCGSLTSVTMLGECPAAKNEIFKDCGKLKAIHVPANAKSWEGMKEWQGIPLVFDAEAK